MTIATSAYLRNLLEGSAVSMILSMTFVVVR